MALHNNHDKSARGGILARFVHNRSWRRLITPHEISHVGRWCSPDPPMTPVTTTQGDPFGPVALILWMAGGWRPDFKKEELY